MVENYEVFTDGGCAPNPGFGGYGIVIKKKDDQTFYVGGEGDSTNNRMEFMAAISAVRLLPKGSQTVLYTDSQLVVNVLTGVWEGKQTKPFLDEFKTASLGKFVRLKWVKGHAGHPVNELADKLATWARKFNSQQKGFDSPAWGPVNVTNRFKP